MAAPKDIVSEQTWRACVKPHTLVRWSRRVGYARKFLLLSCAIVRHWPGGVRSDLGRRLLPAIEQVARQPEIPRGLRLYEDILRPLFPPAYQAEEFSRAVQQAYEVLRGDRYWLWAFVEQGGRPSRTDKGLPNTLIGQAPVGLYAQVTEETAAEVAAIRATLAAGPAGFFGRMLGLGHPPARQLRAAILARLPDGPPRVGASVMAAQRELHAHRLAERARDLSVTLCGLVREVFGDPFRPWRPRPEWLAADDGSVVRIAEHIERAGFAEMPVLGDALEDAGCNDAAALAHCRGGGPHVPGCWVVDAVLRR